MESSPTTTRHYIPSGYRWDPEDPHADICVGCGFFLRSAGKHADGVRLGGGVVKKPNPKFTAMGLRLEAAIAKSSYKNKSKFLRDIDVCGATLYRYQVGVRIPSGDMLLRMANALGVTTDYILGLDENSEGAAIPPVVAPDAAPYPKGSRAKVDDLIDQARALASELNRWADRMERS